MISLRNQPDGSPATRRQAVAESSSSRIVPKPVPASQARDPREYQLGQLRKRYSPRESQLADGTSSLVFKLAPSDPDFPFELAHLECDLRVPADYPQERPTLQVKNRDIPRGFGINIERGWDRLAEEKRGLTLLALTRELDRHLEEFLSAQKAETVKLVAFKDTRHLDAEAAKPVVPEQPVVAAPVKPAQKPPAPKPYVPEKSFTKDEIAEAKARRAKEVHQLEARMKRGDAYHRSPDGIVYTLPLEPRRRAELPEGLQGISTMHLIIPLLYPLQDLRVQLNEADPELAEVVEELFTEKVRQQPQLSLMSHINYLGQNLHRLAKEAEKQIEKKKTEVEALQEALPAIEESKDKGEAQAPVPAGDKSHVQVIPRPPEWSLVYGEDDSSDDYTDEDGEEQGGATLGTQDVPVPAPESDTEASPAMVTTDTPERGTMLSFPSIELHNIELLTVSVLNLSVKCDRCRTLNDLPALQPNIERTSSCKKCATPFAARFRPQLVHAHSTRAGFLDLAGCRVADLLPSTFAPTCASCSTTAPGMLSVRGETTLNVCRTCHARFSFKLPDVRFLQFSSGAASLPAASGPQRKREKLGLHAGEELPRKGACAHYRRSYRWFRFSCCSRVYACDRCHDEAEEHVNEWATRMICGWCSREQNYKVEACGFCGRSVIGRKGRGFWEGGKGTRDQRMMSRKDPRKYKRIGGTAAGK